MKFACLMCGLGECNTMVVMVFVILRGRERRRRGEERRGEEMSLSCSLPLYCTVLYTLNGQAMMGFWD